MDIQLTADQDAFIRQAIADGRIARPEDAVADALDVWEERERRRAELLAALIAAEALIARGKTIELTAGSLGQLACDIKTRSRVARM